MVRGNKIFYVSLISVLVIISFLPVHPKSQIQSIDQYNDALKLIGKKQVEQAETLLKKLVQQDSSFYRAYIRIFYLNKYRKTLNAADDYFNHLLEASPANPFAHHALGLVLREKKQWKEAYSHILKAMQIDPSYFAAYPDFVSVNRKYEWAEQTFLQLLEKKPNSAPAYYGLAHSYSLQYKSKMQLEAAKKASQLQPDWADTWYYLADAYYTDGKFEEAFRDCNLGLSLSRKQIDIELEIKFLLQLGFILNKQGELKNANSQMKLALQLARAIGDRVREAETLQSLARIHLYNGNNREALRYATQAYQMQVQLENPAGQASNLNYMAMMNHELGDYSKALDLFDQARILDRKLGDRDSEAICMGNLAVTLHSIGRFDRALEAFDQSLTMLNDFEHGFEKPKAAYLRGKAMTLTSLGKHQQALQCLSQSMPLLKKLKTEDHQIASTLTLMGKIYQQLGEDALALSHYQSALGTHPTIAKQYVEANASLNLAHLYLSMGQADKAYRAFEKAANYGMLHQDMEMLWQARAGLGKLYYNKRDLHRALTEYESAIGSLGQLRDKLQVEQEGDEFLADKVNVYGDMVSVLFDLSGQAPAKGYQSQAFDVAEKTKAGKFREALRKGQIFQSLSEIPLDLKMDLLAKERELADKHNELSQELSKENGTQDQTLLFSLQRKIESLQRAKNLLMESVKEMSPRYHELINRRSPGVEEIQKEFLNDNQVLIEYLVSENETFIWVITAQEFQFFKIDLARNQLSEKLAAASPLFQKSKMQTTMPIDHRWANMKTKPLHELYQVLLENPLNDLLQPGKELIIVPDDILHYFPFEILVTNSDDQDVHYLVESHSIKYSPSASLLAKKSANEKTLRNNILALGSPDFDYDQSKGLVDWVNAILPFKTVLRGERFEPLPYAEHEVNVIAENFQTSRVLIGKEATEENFKKLAPDYNYLHIATHNLTDDKHPMYSKIILAQSENESEDGLLQTYEVYNMKLNADLVVLSGCSTGLGKLSRGEGLVGMSRAFMFAGVPSLLVSLWPVSDESTAELMNHFYTNLRNGASKTEALQQAKLSLIKSTDWKRDPFYWGAFVLIGGVSGNN